MRQIAAKHGAHSNQVSQWKRKTSERLVQVFERDALARELGKSRSTLGCCLRELAAKRICKVQGASNQYRRSRLRGHSEYWLYEVAADPDAEQSERAATGVGAYVAQVRPIFAEPGCVQGQFGAADECLAADWQ